jgi:hypothetical protein
MFQDELVKAVGKLGHKRESFDFQKHKEGKKEGKIKREYPAEVSRDLAGKKNQQEGWKDYDEAKDDGINPNADKEYKGIV